MQNSFIVIPAIDNPAATQWLLRGATVDLEAGIQVLQAFLDPGLRRGDALIPSCVQDWAGINPGINPAPTSLARCAS